MSLKIKFLSNILHFKPSFFFLIGSWAVIAAPQTTLQIEVTEC